MKELSLHILDIVQNSITAKATRIDIKVAENPDKNQLTITITDNGSGMSPTALKQATDPYYTSRQTRKVGLGLSLFKQAAEQCGGCFKIISDPETGTKIKVSMQYKHIDRQPMGDIAGVITLLASSNPDIYFRYEHKTPSGKYVFDTLKIMKVIENISIADPNILRFIREMIQENLRNINTTT